MNTSAHVSPDSRTKIVNLLVAVKGVHDQLLREGRLASALSLVDVLHCLNDALDTYGETRPTREGTND